MDRIKYYVIVSIQLCLLMIITTSSAQACGKRKVVSYLIVSGSEAQEGYWPWHAALFHNDAGSSVYKSSIRLGDYDMNTTTDCAEVNEQMVCSPPVQTLEIESIIKHKDYDSIEMSNNIALIRLRGRADTSRSNIKPICLPVTKELRNQKSPYYTLTAWHYDFFSDRLQPTLPV
uniref:Peptidase S1 domain-containing protein n=1 Tax=Anopheles culicifacies TaxID=139723 RepID=A0A182LRU7_9DIPT